MISVASWREIVWCFEELFIAQVVNYMFAADMTSLFKAVNSCIAFMSGCFKFMVKT
jgi:hypothetical protein